MSLLLVGWWLPRRIRIRARRVQRTSYAAAGGLPAAARFLMRRRSRSEAKIRGVIDALKMSISIFVARGAKRDETGLETRRCARQS